MNGAMKEIDDFSVLLQASCIGNPVAAACWFEYADKELECAEWENSLTWLLPEIHPSVRPVTTADADRITRNFGRYTALNRDQRSRLLRSMERFRLSQSRKQPIDRFLDLALAFEIALSEEQGDNAPPSWEESVRSAQLVGGSGRRACAEPVGNRLALRASQLGHARRLAEISRRRDRRSHSAARFGSVRFRDRKAARSRLQAGLERPWTWSPSPRTGRPRPIEHLRCGDTERRVHSNLLQQESTCRRDQNAI